MISRRTHSEGSDAARDNTLRRPGGESRQDAQGNQAPSSVTARSHERGDAVGPDAGTRHVAPNADDRDDT